MTKKEHQIKIINKLIELNELLVDYNKTLTNDPQIRKTYNLYKKKCAKSKENLLNIKNEDVLDSVYKNLFYGKEPIYTLAIALLTSKKIKFYDSKKGHKVFLELEEDYKNKVIKEQKKVAENNKVVEEAKKNGKKVEFLVKDGKMQPVIVDN